MCADKKTLQERKNKIKHFFFFLQSFSTLTNPPTIIEHGKQRKTKFNVYEQHPTRKKQKLTPLIYRLTLQGSNARQI